MREILNYTLTDGIVKAKGQVCTRLMPGTILDAAIVYGVEAPWAVRVWVEKATMGDLENYTWRCFSTGDEIEDEDYAHIKTLHTRGGNAIHLYRKAG